MWWASLSGSILTPAFTSSRYAAFSVAKKSCNVLPRRREMALYWRFAQSLLSRASFSCLFLSFIPREDYDLFDLLWLREVWHVHFLDGQSARDFTKPPNQPCSNQLLLVIFGSCYQRFDFTFVVVKIFRGQTMEIGVKLKTSSHRLAVLT